MYSDKKHKAYNSSVYPVPHDSPRDTKINPNADSELLIMKHHNASSVSGRNPLLQKYALFFLALLVISALFQIGSLAVEKSMGSLSGSIAGEFMKRNGLLGVLIILVQFAAALTLLFTKSLQVARNIILVAGLSLIYSLVLDFVHFNIIGIMLNGFILWKLYELYENL